MLRRFFLFFGLVMIGLVIGLGLPARARLAWETRAAEPQTAAQPHEPARRPAPPPAAAPAPQAQPPATPAGGGPDFTRIAGQAVKGVANISSLQVVRRQASPLD